MYILYQYLSNGFIVVFVINLKSIVKEIVNVLNWFIGGLDQIWSRFCILFRLTASLLIISQDKISRQNLSKVCDDMPFKCQWNLINNFHRHLWKKFDFLKGKFYVKNFNDKTIWDQWTLNTNKFLKYLLIPFAREHLYNCLEIVRWYEVFGQLWSTIVRQRKLRNLTLGKFINLIIWNRFGQNINRIFRKGIRAS